MRAPNRDRWKPTPSMPDPTPGPPSSGLILYQTEDSRPRIE